MYKYNRNHHTSAASVIDAWGAAPKPADGARLFIVGGVAQGEGADYSLFHVFDVRADFPPACELQVDYVSKIESILRAALDNGADSETLLVDVFAVPVVFERGEWAEAGKVYEDFEPVFTQTAPVV